MVGQWFQKLFQPTTGNLVPAILHGDMDEISGYAADPKYPREDLTLVRSLKTKHIPIREFYATLYANITLPNFEAR